ncbi:MAG: type II secretion system F family protein [bacterium]|nr:type II secretion system F family protein [bacterium]
MLYKYRAIDQVSGEEKTGSIEAATVDIAIAALQRRQLVIVSIVIAREVSFWEGLLAMGSKVSYREVVVLSRQISTLFHAQISALRVFQLLAEETENELLRRRLEEVAMDIQGGASLSGSLGKYPDVFSDFYVNMVRSGEESGDLSNTFLYLADYLDRSYELKTKTQNALTYPAFVIVAFIVVMILMLVIVIPKLSAIILETGKELPIYTKIVIGVSNFFINYGVAFGVALAFGAFFFWRFLMTDNGKRVFAQFALELPYVGNLYQRIYLARISDTLHTMLSSGITVVRSVEVSSSVVGNEVYKKLLLNVAQDIRTGVPLSGAMGKHKGLVSGIMIQMIKVGEETGELSNILDTLAKFYKREVDNAVETMIGMIEPAMIILLGVGVGGLMVAILLPMYDIASSF